MAVDTNYDNVLLLLHCDGTDASTTFTDNSPSPKTVTPTGGAQIDTAQFKWGTASVLFDGSGDWLSATVTGGIGSGDMTIECWIRLNSLAADGEIFCIGDIGNTSAFNIVFEVKTTGALRFSVQDGSGGTNVDISTAVSQVTTNTWYHVAATVSSTTATIWLDGVSKQTGTLTGSRSGSRTDFRIGRLATAVPRDFNGWIDDIRITRGVARYTTGFTPPTEAFPDTGPTDISPYINRIGVGSNDIYNHALPINFLYF